MAIATGVAMLVTWFPLSGILHQQSVLNSTLAQISAVRQQSKNLTSQARTLDSKAAATQLAREQYQLVNPGQSLIQVLPSGASGGITAQSVDPGFQPLVSPSSAQLPVSTTATRHHASSGFVARLVRTFEFWR
ncbi:MAG: hypothetical protein B7X07_00065 [Actinobacteria bacterium 21-64-8]|nr:MAG: hypothetical protein B7X07_00065 [Actinobacteria bacterium 21-64-8]